MNIYSANAFANFTQAALGVFDVGINGDTSQLPIDSTMKLGYGTQNAAKGPAMTREQAAASVISFFKNLRLAGVL